jgi:glucokinase
VSSSGEVLAKISGLAQLSQGRETVIADMVDSIVKLRNECGENKLAGIGIGVPGFIDIEKGFIVGSNNLPQFDEFPIRDEIERQLGTRVVLENDANAAALGEQWIGAGKGVKDLVLLTLGTGIGGGIISAGRILHGFVGMAGELGHITVVPNGNPCGCGNRGCLEKHASATAIAGMARIVQLGHNLTSEEVYQLATEGEPRARRVFESMGEALGIGLAALVNIFNFPLYLLSGGPLPAWDFFAPTMLRTLEERSFTFRNTKTRIERAMLGNEAGLYGAAYLGLEAAH